MSEILIRHLRSKIFSDLCVKSSPISISLKRGIEKIAYILKMLRLNSFFCCMSLETGAKFIGWFHLLFAILAVIYFTTIGFSLIIQGKNVK